MCFLCDAPKCVRNLFVVCTMSSSMFPLSFSLLLSTPDVGNNVKPEEHRPTASAHPAGSVHSHDVRVADPAKASPPWRMNERTPIHRPVHCSFSNPYRPLRGSKSTRLRSARSAFRIDVTGLYPSSELDHLPRPAKGTHPQAPVTA